MDFDVQGIDDAPMLLFNLGYMLTFLFYPGQEEPKSFDDFGEKIKLNLVGDTIQLGFFFDPKPHKAFPNIAAKNGLDFFLKLGKRSWKNKWVNTDSFRTIRPGEKFIHYLIYKHMKQFKKNIISTKIQKKRSPKTELEDLTQILTEKQEHLRQELHKC